MNESIEFIKTEENPSEKYLDKLIKQENFFRRLREEKHVDLIASDRIISALEATARFYKNLTENRAAKADNLVEEGQIISCLDQTVVQVVSLVKDRHKNEKSIQKIDRSNIAIFLSSLADINKVVLNRLINLADDRVALNFHLPEKDIINTDEKNKAPEIASNRLFLSFKHAAEFLKYDQGRLVGQIIDSEGDTEAKQLKEKQLGQALELLNQPGLYSSIHLSAVNQSAIGEFSELIDDLENKFLPARPRALDCLLLWLRDQKFFK